MACESQAFLTIEKSLLEEIVERDSLNVAEVELFKSVDCWARNECEKKNLALEGSVGEESSEKGLLEIFISRQERERVRRGVVFGEKKYMLPCLVDKCAEYLGENLDASNVFHVLLGTQKYEEKYLIDKCWKVIVTTEKSLLEELVERDSLNITEAELFKAVDFGLDMNVKRKTWH
ncbi:BTB/POZ domain-containing protein 6 [Stylophora pistillata]|uniref:BTB/POZ domain-containing protein 6 n=1 Tax=Stylophora pistillata TaxID=50429 RepID=A0A2B4R4T7_STYPI|nr:BTB/POZ domain-containing protein 6 [Stylophora pistillata]